MMTINKLVFLFVAPATVLSAQVLAQDAAPAAPCESGVYHAFDFWLGDWEVFLPDGSKAGENTISRQENGCLLLETWTSATGGSGQSYNFYDPGRGVWRQIWVSSFGTIDYAGALNDAGQMVLEGDVSYRNGTTAPFRGTWTPLPDGSVRQYFQQYDVDAKAWNDWFTGIYRRKQR